MTLSPLFRRVARFSAFSLLLSISAIAQQGELRKGASGSGEIVTNSSGTIARRRTRPVRSKGRETSATKTAADYSKQGDLHFDKGQYAEAVKAFEEAIRFDTNNQDLYFALSDAYLKLNDETKSLEANRRGLQVAQSTKTLIDAGVMNSKALSLPPPQIPPIARAARVSGTVTVQITVNEDGDVFAASAVDGHPLLRSAAVKAAMEAKFSPMKVAGVPVKVSGVIEYVFKLE